MIKYINAKEKAGNGMKSIEEMRTSYYEHIEKQRRGYEITAAMIGYVVQKMQDASIISENVSISGRIKSFKSAYENTGKKAVDDCFGLRIIGDYEDLVKIEKELREILVVDSTKDHRKKTETQYNGIHKMVHMDEKYAQNNGMQPEMFPEIEIQYWDEETKQKCLYGELSYANYKKRDLLAILEGLDNDLESVYKNLPVCYEIQGNNIRMLSSQETLYKIYPEIQELEEMRKKVSVPPDTDDVMNR